MRPMKYREGKKRLTIDLPGELFDMFAKLCIDRNVTKTEAVIKYMEYLKEKHHLARKLLDENTIDNFGLDD